MGTYSYDPTQLATNEIYQLRLEVADTDQQAWLLADQEYTYSVSIERNFWCAAARCCELIGTLFTRKVDTKIGRSLQIVYSKTAEQYFTRARLLRNKSLGTVVPYIGGAYAYDYQAIATNTGLISPLFTKTMMENPWTGGYDSDSLVPTTNDSTPVGDEDEDG